VDFVAIQPIDLNFNIFGSDYSFNTFGDYFEFKCISFDRKLPIACIKRDMNIRNICNSKNCPGSFKKL